MAPGLTKLVPRPAPNAINSGLSSLKAATLLKTLGRPRPKLTSNCEPVTSSGMRKRIVTEDVGPFRVTGLDIAVDSLRRVFDDVRRERPDLYDAVGNMGMLCCRLVRGSAHIASNHSWGTAIDLTFNGVLDLRGDDKVQIGLLAIYPFFHRHGWYWGAEFNTEDGMHFELAEETFRKLESAR